MTLRSARAFCDLGVAYIDRIRVRLDALARRVCQLHLKLGIHSLLPEQEHQPKRWIDGRKSVIAWYGLRLDGGEEA